MKLKRENRLSQLVLENIQNSIISGEFKPGELLPSERVMSERYGVGKSSIREAIKMLQVLGVVESTQGKGTYLRKSLGPRILSPFLLEMMLQRSSAEELYEFRLIFERSYMPIASARATEKDKDEAKRSFEKYRALLLQRSAESGDAENSYHYAILAATANKFIVSTGKMTLELCRPYVGAASESIDNVVIDGNEKLLKIFCAGDIDGLDDAVKKSLFHFRSLLDRAAEQKSSA